MPDAGGQRTAASAHLETDRGLSASLRLAKTTSLGTVVCVHGALDGGASFARLRRRLDDADVVVYDRRGYRSSRALPLVEGLDVQVDDVVSVLDAALAHGAREPAVVLGHSFGGLVALGAAARGVERLGAVVVYEPPVRWLLDPEHAHGPAVGTDPEAEAETFFRRIVGDRAWERLGEAEQRARRLDGPALLCDLAVVRGGAAVALGSVHVPVVVGVAATAPTYRHAGSVRLAAAVERSTLVRFEEAGHGAHLSHPDQLAGLVRTALDDAAVG